MKRWPRAIWCAIGGMVVGAIAGLLIGGIGVAMRGGAFGIPTSLVLAIGGAFLGARFGLARDRLAEKRKEAAN